MYFAEEQLQNSLLAQSSLLDEIMAQARISPVDEGYSIARQGVAVFITNLLSSDVAAERVNKSLVDNMIVALDKQLSNQMDELLHAKELQEMESSWRSLKLLVDRTDFKENIRIQLLLATKEELLEDFEFSAEITHPGLYKHWY